MSDDRPNSLSVRANRNHSPDGIASFAASSVAQCRQSHGHRRPLSRAVAVDTDTAVMFLDHIAADRQPQTEAVVASTGSSRLLKAFKDQRKELPVNALPCVQNKDLEYPIAFHQLDIDAPGARELHGIGEHIAKRLLEPFAVAAHHAGRCRQSNRERQSRRSSGWLDDVDGGFDGYPHVESLHA